MNINVEDWGDDSVDKSACQEMKGNGWNLQHVHEDMVFLWGGQREGSLGLVSFDSGAVQQASCVSSENKVESHGAGLP